MEDKQLTEQDSLMLIRQMISTAKKEQVDNGSGWIIWGWMIFGASFFSFLNMRLHWHLNQYLFWNGFGVLTIVFLIFRVIRYFFLKKKSRVVTYTSDLFSKLNIGFTISLFFIITAINVGTRLIAHYQGT